MKLHSIIKSVAGWLGAQRKQTSRRRVGRPALTLEALEERDVPSVFTDIAQFQNDLHYQASSNRWAPDTIIIQNDVNHVQSAALYGQAGSAVNQLQSDMNLESRMFRSSSVSSSYALQNDLQALLRDVNGYGSYNYGSAFNGLGSPGAQTLAYRLFGPPIGSTPLSSSYGNYGSYGTSSSYGGYGSYGGNTNSDNPYPVGSTAYNLQNAALQGLARNGGNPLASSLDGVWMPSVIDYFSGNENGRTPAGAPAQFATAGPLSAALGNGGMVGGAESFLYSPVG